MVVECAESRFDFATVVDDSAVGAYVDCNASVWSSVDEGIKIDDGVTG
jgi:hypothetical protein